MLQNTKQQPISWTSSSLNICWWQCDCVSVQTSNLGLAKDGNEAFWSKTLRCICVDFAFLFCWNQHSVVLKVPCIRDGTVLWCFVCNCFDCFLFICSIHFWFHRSVNIDFWLWPIPWAFCILFYDELRKFLLRRLNFDSISW